jgi:hypothetical protein
MKTTNNETVTAGHTPGPWTFKRIPVYSPTIPDDGFPALDTNTMGGREWMTKAQANARLIAAAPELLSALQTLLHPMASEEDMDNAQALVNRLTT